MHMRDYSCYEGGFVQGKKHGKGLLTKKDSSQEY